MRGIIKSAYYGNNGGIHYIFIVGDDGREYFGHATAFIHKSKHYKKGRTVTFDVQENSERANPEAVNIDVEIPVDPSKQDELLSVEHLPDGAYIKRIRKPSGGEVSLIIKDGKLIISCLPVWEKDMIWMYRRGPSGS